MASLALRVEPKSILRFSVWDACFIALAGVHGAVLLLFPFAPVIAIGLWWNANTISHNFIHRPFFRPRILNRLFSAYLSVLLGFPQTLWRDRHLAHHSGRYAKPRVSRTEVLLVCALWIGLASLRTHFFLVAYLPGWLLGMALCWMQGYYEHAHGTISHYGVLYNWLCFNDGYHAEHHANPGMHWTCLPDHAEPKAAASPWPALLRWLDGEPNRTLEILERLVLRSQILQHFILCTHARACEALLAGMPAPKQVTIVGGALFPRTALILRDLFPHARIVVLDSSAANLDTARAHSGANGIEWLHQRFDASQPSDCDLLVIPLSLQGDRERLYRHPPAPAVLVHDWIWRKRGASRIVSLALLKRINLIRASGHPCEP